MCLVSDGVLKQLLEALKQSCQDKGEGVLTLICHPSYCTRQIVELRNSEHDRQGLLDLSHFMVLLSTLMYAGALGYLSALHFSSKHGQNWNVKRGGGR